MPQYCVLLPKEGRSAKHKQECFSSAKEAAAFAIKTSNRAQRITRITRDGEPYQQCMRGSTGMTYSCKSRAEWRAKALKKMARERRRRR